MTIKDIPVGPDYRKWLSLCVLQELDFVLVEAENAELQFIIKECCITYYLRI